MDFSSPRICFSTQCASMPKIEPHSPTQVRSSYESTWRMFINLLCFQQDQDHKKWASDHKDSSHLPKWVELVLGLKNARPTWFRSLQTCVWHPVTLIQAQEEFNSWPMKIRDDMIMDEHALNEYALGEYARGEHDEYARDEEALIIPGGPVTRSKARKLAGAVRKIIGNARNKEEEGVMQFTNRVIPSLPDLDVRDFFGRFQPNPEELGYKSTCSTILIHQRFMESWNQVDPSFRLEIIQVQTQRILGLLHFGAVTSQRIYCQSFSVLGINSFIKDVPKKLTYALKPSRYKKIQYVPNSRWTELSHIVFNTNQVQHQQSFYNMVRVHHVLLRLSE